MGKFARIENSTALEVFTPPEGFGLADCFTPDVAAQFVPVPDEVAPGWGRDAAGVWTPPPVVVVPSPTVTYPKVGPIRFKLLFTADERIKADTLKATDAYIKDFWSLLDDPRTDEIDMNLVSVQMAITYTLMKVSEAGVAMDVQTRTGQILSNMVV